MSRKILDSIQILDPMVIFEGKRFDGIELADFTRVQNYVGRFSQPIESTRESFLEIEADSTNPLVNHVASIMSSNRSQTVDLVISGIDQNGVEKTLKGKFGISKMSMLPIAVITFLGLGHPEVS